jgi:hypothetical protein
MLDSELHFHRHVDCLHPQELKLLGLIRFITYNFSSSDSIQVVYITLIRSQFEHASVAWNNLTLADSNKLENIQRKFTNFFYNRFNQPSGLINILKSFIPDEKILTLYFLLTFPRTKLIAVLLWIMLVSVYPLSKLETFQPLTSIMSRDLARQQGASRLQTTSANLWAFSIHITYPLRIQIPLRNPIKLRHYRVTCIILQSISSISSSLSLDFVVYNFSAGLV